MKAKVNHTSYLIDFLDVGFNSDEISNILEPEANRALESFNEIKIKDWEVEFRVVYSHKETIQIATFNKSNVADKYKKIVIHIPIPSTEVVAWGVGLDQIVNIRSVDNLKILDVNFNKFDNRSDFIIDSVRRAIDFCFKEGFVVNGIKIKN